jgi:hypothetical protein
MTRCPTCRSTTNLLAELVAVVRAMPEAQREQLRREMLVDLMDSMPLATVMVQ